MEFLGDAALGLVASDYLFDKYPELREGGLTRLRSRFTSGEALARVGHHLGLGAYLFLGKGEHKSGGRRRDSNVLDALEAILGAVYLDGGLKAVRKIFNKVFLPLFEVDPEDYWSDNPKGHLQALAQQRWKIGPRYEVLQRVGPAHAARVSVAVSVGEYARAEASGPTRRDAERRASARLLSQLKQEHRPRARQGGRG
ncbi:MAG: ribonuclease III [Lentisphaerae bacterium]|nr:ribonuclease III [Lentisphaerota bacterium]